MPELRVALTSGTSFTTRGETSIGALQGNAKLPIQVKSAVEMAPAVVSLAGVLLYTYPFLGRALSPQNEADPWIIATAEINGWTVVTDEGSGGGPSRSVLGVCNKRGVPCLN